MWCAFWCWCSYYVSSRKAYVCLLQSIAPLKINIFQIYFFYWIELDTNLCFDEKNFFVHFISGVREAKPLPIPQNKVFKLVAFVRYNFNYVRHMYVTSNHCEWPRFAFKSLKIFVNARCLKRAAKIWKFRITAWIFVCWCEISQTRNNRNKTTLPM